MEILRPGRVPDGRYEGRCDNCGCVVSADPVEVRGDGHGHNSVPCPTGKCGWNIALRPRGGSVELREGR